MASSSFLFFKNYNLHTNCVNIYFVYLYPASLVNLRRVSEEKPCLLLVVMKMMMKSHQSCSVLDLRINNFGFCLPHNLQTKNTWMSIWSFYTEILSRPSCWTPPTHTHTTNTWHQYIIININTDSQGSPTVGPRCLFHSGAFKDPPTHVIKPPPHCIVGSFQFGYCNIWLLV